MKKNTTLIILIIAFLIINLVALALLFFNNPSKSNINDFESCVAAGYPVMESYPRQCTADGKTFVEVIDNSSQLVENYFIDKIWERATNNLGSIPVEGFDPELYIGAFPNLQKTDFHNTEAIGGKWDLQNGELLFVRDNSGEITSADGTLTNEGIKTLFRNIIKRLDLQINTVEGVDNLLDILSENKNFCSSESRNADACIQVYQPVCGYFNQNIQCIKAPCAQIYSNSCFACLDEKVSYWTSGECKI